MNRALLEAGRGMAQSAAAAGWPSAGEIARAMRLDRPTAHVSYTCNVGGITISWVLSADGRPLAEGVAPGAREVTL